MKLGQAVQPLDQNVLHRQLTAAACAQGEIECELPNASLYTFTGNMRLDTGSSAEPAVLPLSQASILLRGCNLRNTAYILGMVIFAGHETKVQPAFSTSSLTRTRAAAGDP